MLRNLLRRPRRDTDPRTAQWQAKQAAAAPARYYGDGGTIHDSGTLDIVVTDSHVTEVWFRCQRLPFRVHFAAEGGGLEPVGYGSTEPWLPILTGVEVLDPEPSGEQR